jgi:hypothetical protein
MQIEKIFRSGQPHRYSFPQVYSPRCAANTRVESTALRITVRVSRYAAQREIFVREVTRSGSTTDWRQQNAANQLPRAWTSIINAASDLVNENEGEPGAVLAWDGCQSRELQPERESKSEQNRNIDYRICRFYGFCRFFKPLKIRKMVKTEARPSVQQSSNPTLSATNH